MRNAAVALAASALAATGGCYHDARQPPPLPPSNKASPPPVIRSDDVLAFLPVDADVVLGLEMRPLRDGELFQHLVEKQVQSGDLDASLQKAHACGIDPLHSLERITAAGHIGDNDKFDGVIVIRGVDGPRALDCVATYGASSGTVTRDHDVVVVHGNDGVDEVATLVGRGTLVVQFGRGVDASKLAATLRSGAPLRTSKAFMGLFDRRESDAALWGMVNGNSRALQKVRGMGLSPRSIDGSIVVTGDLTAVVRVTFASPADADQLVQITSPSLAGGRSMFDKLEVRAEGTSARFELAATEAQIESLWGIFGVMLGRLGGP